MKKSFLAFIVVLSALICVSCGVRKADDGGYSLEDSVMSENANGVVKGNEFTFRKISNEEFREKTSNMRYAGDWIYQTGKAGDEDYALFYGKIQAVFGEPNSQSEDWENMYNYNIEATASDGKKLYFMVYHGAGGPSVSLPTKLESPEEAAYRSASDDLTHIIDDAAPADYVWEGVYEDIPVDIKYTVKNGEVRVDSKFGDI